MISGVNAIMVQNGSAFIDNAATIAGKPSGGGIGVLIGYGQVINEATGTITAFLGVFFNQGGGRSPTTALSGAATGRGFISAAPAPSPTRPAPTSPGTKG